MIPDLGIIEGYYGRPWSRERRDYVIAFLAPRGYRFFLYAPKADEFLRKRWREAYPAEREAHLRGLAAHCRAHGVRFGVGLSPYELYRGFDGEAKTALGERLALFDSVGVEILAILFDDMRGDVPDLARTQVDILHWIAARTKAQKLIMCPTYYTDDPVLDRVFGARPAHDLEELGAMLDPAIEVFWTGEEVCSREYSPGHLARVENQLRRKPFLWDNYPVNDGARMSQFLHLRAFTGRPAAIGSKLAGHAVNPALQPTLSLIPLLTLVDSYELGESYAYGEAFARAAEAVLGPEFARLVRDDLIFLQDTGLDRLGDRRARLHERYAAINHPAAKEIANWLDGVYRFTTEIA
ncbi:MAG TPA: beta-N-acetylglucosaminidase domain-containing protein [Rhizomicrobium sp.]|nr:beta-N-acetylglucosaminidase domain-containing protein [Rhizomicrobium sp.]